MNTTKPEPIRPEPSNDDALRRMAAERLAKYLDHGDKFLLRCAELASGKRGDRLGPLAAAARLMNSNARVAHALAHVALVERRQRTIIERIQPADTREAELISQKRSEGEDAETRLNVLRRMDELVEQSIRARSGETNERDRVAEIIKEEEEELARIQSELIELGADG